MTTAKMYLCITEKHAKFITLLYLLNFNTGIVLLQKGFQKNWYHIIILFDTVVLPKCRDLSMIEEIPKRNYPSNYISDTKTIPPIRYQRSWKRVRMEPDEMTLESREDEMRYRLSNPLR